MAKLTQILILSRQRLLFYITMTTGRKGEVVCLANSDDPRRKIVKPQRANIRNYLCMMLTSSAELAYSLVCPYFF